MRRKIKKMKDKIKYTEEPMGDLVCFTISKECIITAYLTQIKRGTVLMVARKGYANHPCRIMHNKI